MDNPNLVLTLQSLLSYDVLLQPTSDLSQLTGSLRCNSGTVDILCVSYLFFLSRSVGMVQNRFGCFWLSVLNCSGEIIKLWLFIDNMTVSFSHALSRSKVILDISFPNIIFFIAVCNDYIFFCNFPIQNDIQMMLIDIYFFRSAAGYHEYQRRYYVKTK